MLETLLSFCISSLDTATFFGSLRSFATAIAALDSHGVFFLFFFFGMCFSGSS